MTDDITDSIRKRAGGEGSLAGYIEQVGQINTQTESGRQTIYDFFLGPDEAPAFERFDNGEFGGTAIVEDGEVVKATIRIGNLDIPRDGDPFIVTVRIEELIESLDPPVDVEVDVGDFDQGVPHIRYRAPTDGATFGSGVDVDEFGRFMVGSVREVRKNTDALREIGRGERFTL